MQSLLIIQNYVNRFGLWECPGVGYCQKVGRSNPQRWAKRMQEVGHYGILETSQEMPLKDIPSFGSFSKDFFFSPLIACLKPMCIAI
jgi:hypothetical protein